MLRAPLAPVAGCFGAGVALKNLLFRRGLLRTEEVPGLRILSVGNLTVGGAGKTPVVAFLAERLQRSQEPSLPSSAAVTAGAPATCVSWWRGPGRLPLAPGGGGGG